MKLLRTIRHLFSSFTKKEGDWRIKHQEWLDGHRDRFYSRDLHINKTLNKRARQDYEGGYIERPGESSYAVGKPAPLSPDFRLPGDK